MHWCDFLFVHPFVGFEFAFVSLASWICGFIKLIEYLTIIVSNDVSDHPLSGTSVKYTPASLILSLLSL